MRADRFDDLVRRHRRAVEAYAASMASTATIAEDAVQETFLRAWRHLDSFRGTGSFEGWLIRICRRCVFDLESDARRSTATDRLADTVVEPADERSETMALVAALPIDQREVVVVCGVLGFDYRAAAVILDVPVGTVRSRLHRGRAALADAIGRCEQGRASTAGSQRETA